MPAKISTYFGIETTCDVLYEPGSIEELTEIRSKVFATKQRYFVIGAGSNSLVSSRHFPGAIISTRKMLDLEVSGDVIKASAGVDNTVLCQRALDSSLQGIGWMNRLPGLVGATVRMNARCYGGEVSQVVSKVISVSESGQIKTYTDPKEVFYGYKDTAFMTNKEIVAEVEFSLKKGDPQEIKKKMDHCQQDREAKHQFDSPSCGCVFKNNYDIGVPSGMLLEKAEAKYLQGDNIKVSPDHANFIFNNQADSSRVLALSKKMRQAVWERFGAWLEYEMELLGAFTEEEISEYRSTKKQQLKDEIEILRKEFNNKH